MDNFEEKKLWFLRKNVNILRKIFFTDTLAKISQTLCIFFCFRTFKEFFFEKKRDFF